METLLTQPAPEEKKESFWKELVKFILLAVLIVVPIRTFIAQPFIVSGASMDPTFWDGEYLIVDELSYRLGEPKRGEVVIFRYPQDPSKFFIKRLIGLPGEKLVIKSGEITITTAAGNEISWKEPYVEEGRKNTYENITTTLGDNEYYVLGDNRTGSSDSRRWGPVPRNYIVGRPLVRLIPLSKISLFPGDFTSKPLQSEQLLDK